MFVPRHCSRKLGDPFAYPPYYFVVHGRRQHAHVNVLTLFIATLEKSSEPKRTVKRKASSAGNKKIQLFS
jgi:hypothetical protein